MLRSHSLLVLACVLAGSLAADDDVVFKSDVSLVRVDAQVVDSSNRAITHLHATDFVLREDGRDVPIRNFASENMPVDVLFLLDVSASMRPHVQRIADASGQALTVLGKDDRMGIMVFDRYTRVRLALNSNPRDVQREFDRLLRQEGFNGGTDITRAMLDAKVSEANVELRGACVDESPHCYKRLNEVLAAHGNTVRILHTLTPVGVAMAGAGEFDPYKD